MGSPQLEVYESTVTYEGPGNMSHEEWVVSGNVTRDVQMACEAVAAHMKTLDIHLTKGTFYLKIDKIGDVVMLYATNLKTWEMESPFLTGDSWVELTIPLEGVELQKMVKQVMARPQSNYMKGGWGGQLFCPFCEEHV